MEHISEVTGRILVRLYKQRCDDCHRLAVALKEAREVLATINDDVDVSGAIQRCDRVLDDFVIFEPWGDKCAPASEPSLQDLGEHSIG